MNESQTINDILQMFIAEDSATLRLMHIKSNTNLPPDSLVKLIANISCLFEIDSDVNGVIIKAKISLRVCNNYNKTNANDENNNNNNEQGKCTIKNCKFLHICRNTFSNRRGCLTKNCRLNHQFQKHEVLNVLVDNKLLNVDLNILMKFFRKFYFIGSKKQDNEPKSVVSPAQTLVDFSTMVNNSKPLMNAPAAAAAAVQQPPQAPPSQSSLKTEEANTPLVEIILCQKFIKEHGRNYLFELFKKQSGVILYLDYLPDQSVAHVRFKSRPAAEHLIRQKEITLEGYSFIIRLLENSTNLTTNVNNQKPRNRGKNAKQNSNVDNDKKPNSSNKSRKNKNSNNKPQNQNQNGTIASVSTNDFTPLIQNTTTTIDLHRFYLTVPEYNKTEFSTKVERTAAIIAKMKPSSVRLIVPNLGKWLIEFTEDKTFDINELKKTYEIAKNVPILNLVGNIEIENVTVITQTTTSIPSIAPNHQIIKRLNGNEFLKMIIKVKNIQWREELAGLLAKERCKFETDADLIISSVDANEPRSHSAWSKRINAILSTYFKQFEMKTIKYGDNDVTELTRMIDQVRSNFQIDYTNELAKRQIFILGKKTDFQRFLATNRPAAALMDKFRLSVTNNNKPENQSELFDVNLENAHYLFRSVSTASVSSLQVPIIKHVRVSKPVYERHTRLILSLLERLKIHFNLYDYSIDIGQSRIELNGQAANLNSSSAVFEQCLRNIVIKQLEQYEINLLKAKCLPAIVEDSLKMLNHLVFDVSVRSFESDNEPGIFVTYFRNIPEIDSTGDSVYETIKDYINGNIEYIELDLSAQQHLLLSPKWAKFKNEHLVNEKMAKTNYEIILNSSTNATGKCLIQLIGKKTYLHKIRDKIEHFIDENEIKTNNIRLDEEKIKYLSQIAVEEMKHLETLFEVSFDYDQVNLRVKNCRDQMFNIIQSEVNRILSQRVAKIFSTDLIPGIEKILEKNSPFYHDIKTIEKQTNTIIDIKPISTVAKNPKPSVIPRNVPTYGNQTLKSLFVNQSIFNLQTGNITNSQTNVIVTVTNKDPLETSGMLATSIIKKAGREVLMELVQNKSTDVKVTNSGSLLEQNGVLSIFHCLLPQFSDIVTSTTELKTYVTLCLTKLVELNFVTITFPTLGMGLLGYSPDLVAKVMFSSVYEFLKKNDGLKLTVNLVIYENDKASSNIFLNEFEKLDKQSGQEIQHNKAQLKSSFNITSPSEEKYKQATGLLKKLIDEKYTKKETIGKDMLKYTSDEDIAKLIASISAKYKNCQISCRQRTIEFYGDKESVMEAKASMLGSITQMNNQNYTQIEETMKITRNMQWQYETGRNNEWKNFPLFLNSLIETKFSKKESKVTFVNEDNEEAVIYMNINPMVYQRGKLVSNVKRVDVTKMNETFKFPETWSPMSDTKDYELVDVPNNSIEAREVFADFINKLPGKNITSFKLQRIQNPCLYKQYMIHKEKFSKESRQCNEKTLFHGSAEDSLKKICRFGFNRSFCGKNGVAFGQGVYFAVNSAYSDRYAGVVAGTQVKCMIRALVLVGDSVLGNSGMKTPPEMQGANRQYDSTCDSAQSIFVCYHDNQCYPQYLIYYQ